MKNIFLALIQGKIIEAKYIVNYHLNFFEIEDLSFFVINFFNIDKSQKFFVIANIK